MVDSFDVFGRTVYAEYIKALIVGLPEVSPGRPALSMVDAVRRKGADALPAGYGRPFAKGVYRVARRYFWSHEVVDEAMLTVVTTAVRGRVYLTPGSDLCAAQRYVLVATMNSAKNVLRTRWRRQRLEVQPVPEHDEDPIDFVDPGSLDEAERATSALQLRRLVDHLGGVHPRAADYVKAVLAGDSIARMARSWNVEPSFIRALRRTVEPHVRLLRSRGTSTAPNPTRDAITALVAPASR